jgi:transposase
MDDDSKINWKERYFELLKRLETLEAEIQKLRLANQELQLANQELQLANQELRERLNTNSKNSSKPPSQDPFRKRRSAQSTGKNPGGQPGHPGHKRTLHPPEEVTSTIDLRPQSCPHCKAAAFDGESVSIECRQVVELPEIRPDVTQYNIHTCRCGECGKHVRPEVPKEAEHGFGPRFMAFVTMLTSEGSVTKRKIRAISGHLGIKISLGGICNIHRLATAILEPSYHEIHAVVMEQDNINADESGWWICRKRSWIWIAATPVATVFKIDPSRSQAAFRRVFCGYSGTVTSDRYSAYNVYVGHKQTCLAHIDRDIEKVCDRNGPEGALGRILEGQFDLIFGLWKQFKEQIISRNELRERAQSLVANVELALRALASSEEVSNAGAAFAYDLLGRFSTLWLFLDQENVEPTNNLAERGLRPAVILRKLSGGSQSEWGASFTERLLTVSCTLKQRAGNIFTFLTESFQAYAGTGPPAPSVLRS